MVDFGGIDVAIITAIITAIIAIISSAIASIMTYIFNRKLKETEQRSTKKLKSLEFEYNEKLQNLTQMHQQNLSDSNNRFQAELEVLKKQLESQKSEQDARRNYEYEAKKHLYEVCEPLLFQIVELSDDALQQIFGLALSAKLGHLEPNAGWLSGVGYYMMSTVHLLLAPMSAF